LKITLIYPHLWGGVRSTDALQPLAIAALAAHIPESWEVRFYDERLEPVPIEELTDLAVFSVMTFTARRAYSLAGEYRKRGIPVVMGGFHPTLMPEEAAQYADSVVTGDLENHWSRVLEDAEKGRLKALYSGGIAEHPESIRFDRRLFRGKRYAPMVPVQFSRGCRYSCDFCSIHSFYGSSRVVRPLEQVLEEIREIRSRYLLFTDDNLFVEDQDILMIGKVIPERKCCGGYTKKN
jgi:radical SAM superfamily enzyme YgiQ (UPF0313 family)